jgi:hypothetical protein
MIAAGLILSAFPGIYAGMAKLVTTTQPAKSCRGPRQRLINSIEELARDIPVSF